MTDDAYEICRYVKRYHEKNGYAPTLEMLNCDAAFADLLVNNGIIEVRPLYEGGRPIKVFLTDKGMRMATAERRRQ